jgi:quercetin dioxygenase-like cupin family protein
VSNDSAHRPVRRVITGHGPDGAAKVLVDGPSNVRALSPSLTRTAIWRTRGAPAEIALGEQIEDLVERTAPLPFAEGSRFLIFEFAPGHVSDRHRSETIDYAIVLDGEVTLELDATSVTLQAGDVAVQRGTNHVWANRGTAPALVAIVMVEATPLNLSPETTVR